MQLESAKWVIPAEKAKGKKPITIMLSPEALKILNRHKKQATGEWVFPSTHPRRKSKSGHFEEPKSLWKDLVNRAGLRDIRLHDLRRTFGSWQLSQGTSEAVIGKTLGHRNQASTKIYTRLAEGPLRDAVNGANAAMVAAATAKPASGRNRR